jgi:hypothetical protein
MAELSKRRIAELLERGRDEHCTTTDQGTALEDLVCYLFGRMPGIEVTHRNSLNVFATEEIDVALWNGRRAGALDFLPHVILVEAKSWSRPVGSAEVAWFDRKLQDRGLDLGILVALRGVTGTPEDRTAAHQIVAGSLRDQRRLLLVTGDDIVRLQNTGELVKLLKKGLCELAVTGTLFP